MMKKATAKARLLLPLLLAAAVVLSCVPVVPAAAAAQSSAASDVTQLTRSTGKVQLVNSYGRELAVRDEMRLYNGTQILTGADGYAWLSMDSAKSVKLNASSAVELRRAGLRQEVLLEAGELYFSAAEPPAEAQTLCLRTAAVAAYLDNASGYAEQIDRWNTRISVLDGEVTYTAADPVTGQRVNGTVEAGQTVQLTVWPQDHTGDKCTVKQQQILFYEIEGYVLEELAQDTLLCGRIYEGLNVDILPPLGLLGSLAQTLDEIKMRPAQVRDLVQAEGDTDQVRQTIDELRHQLEQLWQQLDDAGLESQTAKQGLQHAQALLQAAQLDVENDDLEAAVQQLEDGRKALEQALQYAAETAMNGSLEMAQERLVQDQAMDRELQAVIDEQLEAQEKNIAQDPVWKEPEPTATPAPTSAPAGGMVDLGSYTPAPTPVPTPVVLVMGEFTLDQLQKALNSARAGVIVRPNKDPEKNTLTVPADEALYVFPGRSLTFEATEDLPIEIVVEGATDDKSAGMFSVYGTMNAPNCTITNSGTMSVTGTLDADGVTNYGTLTVYGKVTGSITQEAGRLGIQSTVQNGETITPDIGGGILLHGGALTMSAGWVHNGIEQTRETGDPDCTASITGGLITGGYYYHYDLNDDAKSGLEGQAKTDEKKFNLTIEGSATVQYVEGEAPEGMEPQAALVVENDSFATNASVAVSGGSTIDGGPGPAISAKGTWKNPATVAESVTVKGGVPDLVQSEVTDNPIKVYGASVTEHSYLVTEELEEGVYQLKEVYADFQDALEKAASGQTVILEEEEFTLDKDVTVRDGVTLKLNDHTLDLGDYTINLIGKLKVTGGGTITGNKAVFKLAGTYDAEKDWNDVLTIEDGVTVKSKTKDLIVDSGNKPVGNPEDYIDGPDGDSYYTLTKTAGIALTSLEDEQLPEDPDASQEPEPAEEAEPTEEPEVTEEPEATEEPEQEDESDDEPSEEAEPTGEPEVTEEPEDEPADEPTDSPEPVDSENQEVVE